MPGTAFPRKPGTGSSELPLSHCLERAQRACSLLLVKSYNMFRDLIERRFFLLSTERIQ